MAADKPIVKGSIFGRIRLFHGDCVVTLVGAAVVGVFLIAMAATVWNTARSQRRIAQQADVEKLRAVGALLANTVDALLAANEISTLRRVIAETSVSDEFDSCRVVLPDGRVVADALPARITCQKLPETWSGSAGLEQETVDGQAVSLSYPVEVPGRGSARLEIMATVSRPPAAQAAAQSGQWIIIGLALVALLIVYRQGRARFRVIDAIRQALLASKSGERAMAALEVSPHFGPEAEAWNKLLAETEELKNKAVLTQAKASLRPGFGAGNELGAACDALPQGLILIDGNGRAKYANGAASVLLQSSPETIMNNQMSQFIRDERVLVAVENAVAGPSYKRTIIEVEQDESD